MKAYETLDKLEIPARIIDVNALTAELLEIEENLVRNELTELEKAEQLKRRKEIYEQLHPETTQTAINKVNARKRNDFVSINKNTVKSFTEDTAKKMGVSSRAIQQSVQIANNITEEVKEKIRGTKLANNKTGLLKIAKIEPQKQEEAVKEILNKNKQNQYQKVLNANNVKYLHKPEKFLGMNGFLNKEERYIVVQNYKLPIPGGIDLNILDKRYIEIVSIFSANDKFNLGLKPFYTGNSCQDCTFYQEAEMKSIKKQKRNKPNEIEKAEILRNQLKYRKTLLSPNYQKKCVETLENNIAILKQQKLEKKN